MRLVTRRLGIGLSLATLALTFLAAGPLAAQNETNNDPVLSFLPTADGVFLEKTSDFPGFGNARILVQLTDEQVQALEDETGRRDFVVIGPPEMQTILRDDGLGADQAAGDFLFTGIGTVDEEELNQRAADDATNAQESRGEVAVFDGRVFTGFAPAEPFDAAGFAAGNRVKLGDPVEAVTGEVASSGEQQALRATLKATGAELSSDELFDAMAVLGTNNFQDRSLMIVHPSVTTDATRTMDMCTGVGNPNGVWTFKHLMTEMANQTASGIDPRVFTENWLNNWLVNQTINGDPVPNRQFVMQNLINEWKNQGGGGPLLNLDVSPVRLLAIVARLDLATTTGGGGGGYGTRTGDFLDAGEARFVFGVVLPPGWANPGFSFTTPITGAPGCGAAPFSIIFEYRVPKCKCEGVRDWARQWRNLSTLAFPSATYNKALERITQQFVRKNANPARPNGSAIGQVRTNEIALAGPWELREFQLTQKPFSFLNETTVNDTPRDSANNTIDFGNWVNGNTSPMPPVPLFFAGATPTNFLGGRATTLNPGDFWTDASIPAATKTQERFEASIATCDGCHGGEAKKAAMGFTPFFVHIDPSSPTLPPVLSGFLTGINMVPDRAFGVPLRDFDDLARRELDMKRKARMLCAKLHPVNISLVRSALGKALPAQPTTAQLPDDLFQGLEPLPLGDQIPVAADALDSPATREVH